MNEKKEITLADIAKKLDNIDFMQLQLNNEIAAVQSTLAAILEHFDHLLPDEDGS